MAIASTIPNEKRKLLAIFVNSIAIAIFFAGVIVPVARILFEEGSRTSPVSLLFMFVGSVGTHLLASSVLSDLEEE